MNFVAQHVIVYIGKTDRNFGTSVQGRSGSYKKSPVYNHWWNVNILIIW